MKINNYFSREDHRLPLAEILAPETVSQKLRKDRKKIIIHQEPQQNEHTYLLTTYDTDMNMIPVIYSHVKNKVNLPFMLFQDCMQEIP